VEKKRAQPSCVNRREEEQLNSPVKWVHENIKTGNNPKRILNET
jgi:hypothetical protein